MSDDIEERLAAWLDGALPQDEAEAFEAELARNPELAARAAEWKANDAFIAGALGPIGEAPLDAALLARMGLAEPDALPVAANDNPPWWRRHALPLGGAIAASLVAALLLTMPQKPERDALSLALDTTPSLKQVRLADGRMIEPTLTVRSGDGRWCREFRSNGETSLACRGDQGWTIEASAKGSGPADGGEIGLAGGGDSAALAGAYQRIEASDPLGVDQEAALIAKGWGER